MSSADAKRVIRFVQMEQIRERLRNIPASTIPYGEFVRICGDACGNREMGLEFAKALDESGNVIVLGGVVFLRPDQVYIYFSLNSSLTDKIIGLYLK